MLASMANEPQQKPTATKAKSDGTVVAVINNLEALQQIALKPERGMGTLVPAQAITLQPGVNFIDTEKWQEAADNPQTKRLLEAKIPLSKAPQFNRECVGKPYLVAMPQTLPKDNPMSGFTDEVALALVEEMNDARELAKYEKLERRDAVRSAMRTRHAIITKKADRAS